MRGAGEAGAELSEPGAGRSAETAGAGQTESGTDAPPDAAARCERTRGGQRALRRKARWSEAGRREQKRRVETCMPRLTENKNVSTVS